MKLIGGYQDTRTNGEDLAITPYLFRVKSIGKIVKVYGIGVCFGYWSIYLGLGFGIPKGHPRFSVLK